MKNAIVRTPAPNLDEGLTTVNLGAPNYDLALKQHDQYCAALQYCGLELTRLDAAKTFPDSTFVEDTAVLTKQCAILTRPGAQSRLGEVNEISQTLGRWFGSVKRIQAPGTLDGGDVCEAGNHYFVGISERTNESGALQLRDLLASFGHSCSFIDIRGMKGLLHLKSGLASAGDGRLVVIDALAHFPQFAEYELIAVPTGEEYAANCVLVNDYLLVAKGYPKFTATLTGLGYQTIELEMSEFQKIDGGLSCLSLRF